MNLLEQLQQLAPLATQATAGPWAAISTGDFVENYDMKGPGIQRVALHLRCNAAFIAADAA